jgi:glycine/serine hydroxymethyltransferase
LNIPFLRNHLTPNQARTEEFKEYQIQTLKNAKVLGEEMVKLGYQLVSGGTDNHLILVDLKPKVCYLALDFFICTDEGFYLLWLTRSL